MPPEAPVVNTQTNQSQSESQPKQDSTGTLIDQSQGTTETKVEPKVEAKTEDKTQSLLNQDQKIEDKAKTETKTDAKPVVPEKYEFKVPDGYEVTEDVTTAFKDAGLTQEAAQKMVDLHLAKTEAAAQAPYDLWQKTQEDWVKEIKADPEIGGKLDQVRSTTAKAIDSLGPELAKSFREALNFTGAGNNPTFVKAFYKWAQQLTEGTHVPSGGPVINKPPGSDAKPTAAQAMYPNLSKG